MHASCGLSLRALDVADLPAAVEFLEAERSHNLYHLANLSQFGMGYPGLQYFGAFAGGRLVAELMFFRHGAGVYWQEPAAVPALAHLLRQERANALSGKRDQIDPLLACLPPKALATNMAAVISRLSPGALRPWKECGERLATENDLDGLTELYAQNLLLTNLPPNEHRRRLLSTLHTGGLITLLERDGKVVSAARTSSRGYGMGMVGGVVTLPDYRSQGLARACTGLLSRLLLESGQAPHLTFDPLNLSAAKVYQTLGYCPVGDWRIVLFQPEQLALPAD